MQINVGTYGRGTGWAHWIEPKDEQWLILIKNNGTAYFYPKRDEATGATIGVGTTSRPRSKKVKKVLDKG